MKTNYKKIDIYLKQDSVFKYKCSTTWHKTCKNAKKMYLLTNENLKESDILVRFA